MNFNAIVVARIQQRLNRPPAINAGLNMKSIVVVVDVVVVLAEGGSAG